MKTLKSHTEQVIQKFDREFWQERHHLVMSNGDDTYSAATPSEVKAFLIKALKELSDLQAEETRVDIKIVEASDEMMEELELLDARRIFMLGQINYASRGIQQTEKLSNAFRNL